MVLKELNMNKILEIEDSIIDSKLGILLPQHLYIVRNRRDDNPEIITCHLIIENVNYVSYDTYVYYLDGVNIISARLSGISLYSEFIVDRINNRETYYLERPIARQHVKAIKEIRKLGYKLR